jgi:Cyclic nucleotide-binding domain
MYVTYDSEIMSRAPAITIPGRAPSGAARDHVVRLRPGQHLFHQGDDARTIYRVTEGVVRLSRVTERGHEQVIAFGYPGDLVGLPVRGLRNTDCDALTAATLTACPMSRRAAPPRPHSSPPPRSGSLAQCRNI